MKRKIIKFGFLLVLLMGLIACSSTNTSNSDNSSSNSNSGDKNEASSEASDQTFKLISSSHTPPGPMSDAFDAFLDEIENRTDGRVQFERFYQGALAGGTDVVDAVKSGVADIALINPSQQSGRLPLATVGTNPAVFNNTWAATKALTEMYDQIPELKNELEAVGVVDIGWVTMPSAYIMTTSKPITSIEDLKGMRILSNTRGITTLIDNIGATPIGIPIVDFYEALSKGTADGVTISYQAGTTNGIHEAVKYSWELPVGGGNMFYGINKNVWDTFPDDIKGIIEEIKYDFQPDSFYKMYVQEGDKVAVQEFVDTGIEISSPSEADLQDLLDNYVDNVWDTWIKEAEDEGKPGQKVIETFRELVEKYENEYPF
jgi:TRAP-type transport system periplasmic protein